MDLERIQFVPRVRGDAQAIDLGIRLARVFYWRLVWPGLVLLPLMAVGLYWLFPTGYLFLASAVLWWCKPVIEQLILLNGSRLVFDEQPKLRALCLMLLKQYLPDMVALLTWRRLSPFRSFDLPVAYLERLRGHARLRRISDLHIKGSGLALLLTVTGFIMEWVLQLGVYFFVDMLFGNPIATPDGMSAPWVHVGGVGLSDMLIAAFMMAIVAPFYTMSGFALYLNRRIALEGWDIDVAFRQLQMRLEHDREVLKKRRSTMGLRGLVLCALIGVWTVVPANSFAQLSTPIDGTKAVAQAQAQAQAQVLMPIIDGPRERSRMAIKNILNGKDFHRVIAKGEWEPINPPSHNEPLFPNSERLIAFIELLEKWDLIGSADGLAEAISVLNQLIRVLFVVLVLVPILYFAFRYRQFYLQWLRQFSALLSRDVKTANQGKVRAFAKQQYMSLQGGPERVRALWASGCAREAVSLWYRQMLAYLSKKGLLIEPYHTEHDCLHLLKATIQARQPHDQALVQQYAMLERIVVLWQQCAYGQHQPSPEVFDALLVQWTQAILHES